MEALEKLPEVFRITVILVNVEGLSHVVGAEVLGVTPVTACSRIKRGPTLLQKALWEHVSEAGLMDMP